MDKNFFSRNRQKFVSQMADNSLLVLFAGVAKHRTADQSYEFTPNRNFFYLTGLDRQEFILMIMKLRGKVEEQLFISKPNPDIEKWTGIRMRIEEAKEVSGIEKIGFTDDFSATFDRLVGSNHFQNVYLDTQHRTEGFLSMGLDFAEFIKKNFPHLSVISANYLIHDFRTIKEKEEIAEMKKAINITKQGIEAIMKNIKPGMIERQLDAYFDFTILYNGANARSFNTIAASGFNATILHYEENKCVLQDNTMVLLDLGCESSYYCSDISRTIPVNGKFTPRQKQVYEAVLHVNEEIIKLVKPGLLYKDFQSTAKDMLAEACIKLGLITDKKDVTKYYYHGVGHFLGLDVHDVGRTDLGERAFEPGMVVTVEPGLYIAEENIGVRIEDDVLITENGCENLSKDIIKSVKDIEKFMSK